MTAAMTGPRTGKKMCAYLNTGTVATPVWDTVDEIGDLNLDWKRAVATLERRANEFAKVLPSLFDVIGVTFKLHYGLDTTTYDLIRADFVNGDVNEWAIMDTDITHTGAQGLRLPVLVEEFPWAQPLTDVAGHDVKLSCAYMEESSTEVDPSWYTVT